MSYCTARPQGQRMSSHVVCCYQLLNWIKVTRLENLRIIYCSQSDCLWASFLIFWQTKSVFLVLHTVSGFPSNSRLHKLYLNCNVSAGSSSLLCSCERALLSSRYPGALRQNFTGGPMFSDSHLVSKYSKHYTCGKKDLSLLPLYPMAATWTS